MSDNSDVVSISQNAIQAQIEVKATTGGSPAEGDQLEFIILGSLGDPDGSSSNEFASNEHGLWVATLDIGQDNPVIKVGELSLPMEELKVRCENNSGFNCTVSATILEQLA